MSRTPSPPDVAAKANDSKARVTVRQLGAQPQVAAGIHSLDHFALSVPDLGETQRFLTAFGLRTERTGGELQVYVEGSKHLWARIFAGEAKKRLEYMSFGCYAEDFEILRAQVEPAGGILTAPHGRSPEDGFWLRDVDRNLIQVKVAEKTMPDFKATLADETIQPGVHGAPPRSQAPEARPSRLCHLAIFTPNVTRSTSFYQRALGLLIADRSRDVIAFTYGRHGSDHHLLALLASQGAGLHHSSWEMGGLNAVGLGAERLRSAGYTHQWGLGRHVLGSNYFNYISDGRGQWWEQICGIDYIPKGTAWNGGDYGEEDGFYLWGPPVPSDFTTNAEL